jgi:hypothetical protein
MTMTPDSVPSLANISLVSSSEEDVTGKNRILCFQTPPKVEVTTTTDSNSSDATELAVISTDSNIGTSTTSPFESPEGLSILSDDDQTHNNVQNQTGMFSSSDCVEVYPSLASPATTYHNGSLVGNEIEIREMKEEECSPEADTPISSFCSAGLVIPAEGMFNMFDLSPRIWPGWSLASPASSSLSSPPPNDKQEAQSIHGNKQDLQEYPPNPRTPNTPKILPKKLNFGYSPEDSDMDPVIEIVETPPRYSVKKHFEKHQDEGSPHSETLDSVTDAETAVASNLNLTGSWERRVDDLEKCCAALKEIIRADSRTMLQLKAELALVRNEYRNTIAKTSSLATVRLHEDLRRAQTERDYLLERDVENMETVQMLKDEVNGFAMQCRELQALRIENKLLTKQSISQENECKRMNDTIKSLEEENFSLKLELALTEDHTEDRSLTTEFLSNAAAEVLQRQLETLSARISEIESVKEISQSGYSTVGPIYKEKMATVVSTCNVLLAESQVNSSSRKKKQSMAHTNTNAETFLEPKKEQHVREKVEVTLEGSIITTGCNRETDTYIMTCDKHMGPTNENFKSVAKKKSRWCGLRDCFP